MKKFNFFALALATVIACAGITSCGDDDDEPKNPIENDGSSDDDEEDGEEWVRCSYCGGTGECIRCDGDGLWLGNYETCTKCDGDGICHYCDGKGGYYL